MCMGDLDRCYSPVGALIAGSKMPGAMTPALIHSKVEMNWGQFHRVQHEEWAHYLHVV